MSHIRSSVARRRLRERHIDDRRSSVMKTSLLTMLILVPLGALFVGGVGFGVYHHYASDYEPIEEVLVQRPSGITRVYDRTGEVELGVLQNAAAQLSEPVTLEEISPDLIDATIATEDNSFWDHPGINVRGVLRAVQENYVGGGIGTGSGGSSITQQLVKNVYICPSFTDPEDDPCVAERTVDRKLREMAYAFQLEQDHSKEEILNWYLNQISYGDRYIGVQAASRGYFRKAASQLTLAESALLAGVPASPSTYHPRTNCVTDDDGACIVDDQGRTTLAGAAKDRQEHVLDLMVENGYITPAEAQEARAETVHVYHTGATEAQRASAFIDNQIEPRLVRMCEAGEVPMLEGAENCVESVAGSGWSVRTTLDWDKTQAAQAMIEEYVSRGLERGCDCHNAAVVTIEPENGQITVYAPNRNQDNEGDPRIAGHIDQLAEINQPGSALKPAVYLAWFDYLNKTPASTLWDTSPLPLDPDEDVVDEGVAIVNPRPGGGGEGLITARSALGGSQNVPAFRAAAEAGIENVIEMSKRLGITTLHQGFDPTFLNHSALVYGPTIATGGANIRAIDMAYMNATIANMGVMVGLPHHAPYIDDLSGLKSILLSEGEDEIVANQQMSAFHHGHWRLPGTRELDPVAILEIHDSAGNLVYEAPEPERVRTVDAGSTWLLHSILSDCQARWIIWACGTSNDDTRLDVFVDGEMLPAGVKTGTQQGPTDRSDVLATWVTGYSRYAATAVWVGNANKTLIKDGPAAGYASGHTSLGIYKGWMAQYHNLIQEERGLEEFADFEALQPSNVTYDSFRSPTTERGHRGGCFQTVRSWQRTDIEYEYDCVNGVVKLPDYKREAAIDLARSLGIRVQGSRVAAPSQSGPSRSLSPGGSGSTAPAPTPVPATPTPAPQPTATPAPQPTATPVPVEPTPVPAEPTPAPTQVPPTPVPDEASGDSASTGDATGEANAEGSSNAGASSPSPGSSASE